MSTDGYVAGYEVAAVDEGTVITLTVLREALRRGACSPGGELHPRL